MQKKNIVFRKSLVIGIILLFIGASLIPINCGKLNQNIIDIIRKNISFDPGDELDQYQLEVEMGFPIGNAPDPPNEEPCYNWTIAQSFKPSKMILTRIMLFIARAPQMIYPLVMTIRDSLNGDDLVYLKVNPENFSEFGTGMEFEEFDFEDIIVTVNKSYYIVCYTTNETDMIYIWCVNLNSTYANGQTYISGDDGNTWFENLTKVDMVFMTFGRDNNPPYPPLIEGPENGKVGNYYDYDFYAVDPDGDDLAYYVEWGDGGVDEGFIESGGGFTLTHSWSEQGAFTIKAKLIDEYGEESYWAIYPVTMPRSKAINISFQWFLQKHLNMFPILKILLQRLG